MLSTIVPREVINWVYASQELTQKEKKVLTYDPLREASEIREQLASDKRRLAFFFGAGTSMAVGLPSIDDLTTQVSKLLQKPFKTQFENIKAKLQENSNVENVLDHIRTCRELIGDSEEREYDGLKGAKAAKDLDNAVCQAISEVVRGNPAKGLGPHLIFAQWLRLLFICRDWPVEVFTTNYDLLLEQAMEESGVPFFDGFIGSVNPFFVPESVEAEVEGGRINDSGYNYPPRAWTRLWKLHGSINWYMQEYLTNKRKGITRLSGSNTTGGELMIFPSREKYTQSRKLPFITFQDRFRKFVSTGENLVIVMGYSFSDEHLNDILFQGLSSNPRLAIIAFMHEPLSGGIIQYGQEHRNLTLYGPDKACIGGIDAPWSEPSRKPKESEEWPFWDAQSKRFTLGDFANFASFLESFIGFRQSLTTVQAAISSSTDIEVPHHGAS